MAGESLITPEIQALLGREISFTAPEEIGRASLRKFALAIDDMNPLYLDEEFARKTRHRGIIAPPTFICETWQYMTGEIDEEGGFAERIQLNIGGRLLRGGNEYEFFQPVRPEDVITATWKVADAYEKEGKSGRLLFLITEMAFTNQRQELLARNRETLIYQFPP